jgi:aminopeptidase N
MIDVQTAPAQPFVHRREDYRPPAWLVPEVALDLDLDPARTRVRARLSVTRSGSTAAASGRCR